MILRNLLLLGLMIASATLAQEFEVASIKPHAGDIAFSADPAVRGSRVVGTACTLLDMITNAYSVRYDQVTGGPRGSGPITLTLRRKRRVMCLQRPSKPS